MKILAAIIIPLFGAVACDSLGLNEITIYPVNCTTKRPLSRITYEASFDRQLVIEMKEGSPPHRLIGCTVKDERNWRCEDGRLQMTNGDLKSDASCYVSWWQWWYATNDIWLIPAFVLVCILLFMWMILEQIERCFQWLERRKRQK